MNRKSDMESVKFSLVIPAYNRENLIRETIESALDQTEKIDEIIIIDNDSSDKTFEISQDYARTYDNVKAFKNEKNVGMIENWNRGIRIAAGEYVSLLHSDDILPRNWCEIVRDNIEGTKEEVGLYFGISVKAKISGKAVKILSRLRPFSSDKLLKPGESLRELWSKFFFNCNNSAAIIYRKSVLIEFNGFDRTKNIEADQDLHIKILKKYPVRYINKDLIFYRIHEFQSFDKGVKKKTYSDTTDIIIRSINIQKSLLGEWAIEYYYCYIILFIIKLLIVGEAENAKRLFIFQNPFKFRSIMNLPRLLYSEYVTRRLS